MSGTNRPLLRHNPLPDLGDVEFSVGCGAMLDLELARILREFAGGDPVPKYREPVVVQTQQKPKNDNSAGK